MQDNDYYKKYNSSISNTHNWRSVKLCMPFMEDKLRNSENLKILDVGCGTGSITFDVYNNYGSYNKIIGIDTPIELIDTNNNSISASHTTTTTTTNQLEFMQGSIYKLPFNDNEFDIVYCHQVLIHLKDPLIGLNEMKRVLNKNKKGSSLFICESELRSLLVYPLKYQDLISEYFQLQKSTFTRDCFGLSLLELYENSNKNENKNESKSQEWQTNSITNFGVVPWCISQPNDKTTFSNMYINRLNSDDFSKAKYTKVWKDWENDSNSNLILINPFFTLEIS